eukprot:7377063-Prymnesium_polylepis.1
MFVTFCCPLFTGCCTDGGIRRHDSGSTPPVSHAAESLASDASAASAVSYSTETNFTKYPGNVDDAIKFLALNGSEARGAQAKAAAHADCCPMKLSRAITALKDCEQWEAHLASVRAAAAAEPPAAGTAA